jgi:hypothetical protein
MATIRKWLCLIGIAIISGGQSCQSLPSSYACTVTLPQGSYTSPFIAPTNPSTAQFFIYPDSSNNYYGTYGVTSEIWEQAAVWCQFQSTASGDGLWNTSQPPNTYQINPSTGIATLSNGNQYLQGWQPANLPLPKTNCGSFGPFTAAVATWSNNGNTVNLVDNSASYWNGSVAKCTAQ